MNMYDSIGGAIYYIYQIKCVLYGYVEVYDIDSLRLCLYLRSQSYKSK